MNREAESRIRDLERSCRSLRLWCSVLSALTVAACLSSSVGERVVRAERFVLTDSSGAERGVLDCNSDGAFLRLESPDESARVVVGVGHQIAKETLGEMAVPFHHQVYPVLGDLVTEMPWAGLAAITDGPDGTDCIASLSAGIAGRLWLEKGEETSGWLAAVDGGMTMHLEGGTTIEEPFSVLSLGLGSEGTYLSSTWNDERRILLVASEEDTSITLETDPIFDDAVSPAARMSIEGGAGSLRLGESGTEVFRAPAPPPPVESVSPNARGSDG